LFGVFVAGVVYFFRVIDLLGEIIEEDIHVVAVGDLIHDFCHEFKRVGLAFFTTY
jgi:hypothetical protein